MNIYDLVRLACYCGAAIALQLALRVARVYLDKSRWEKPPYPTWRDVLK